MSLITVIIPSWNRPDYLKRCLFSISNQTFKDYEVIVIDDHSSNEKGYKDIVTYFSEKMLLHYIRLPLNRGSQYCRNKGLSLSKGIYVAFVDDDDEWLPQKLERQVAIFESALPELGLVYTWADSRDEDGKIVYEYRGSYRGNDLGPLLDRCFIPSPSVMCRLEAVHRVKGFNEDFVSCQDWDMWTRIVEAGFSYDVVEEVLAIHHIHKSPSIGKSPESQIGFKIYFDKHAQSYIIHGMHKNLSVKYRGIAWWLYKINDFSASMGVLRRSICLWKLNLKAWVRFSQVFGSLVVRKFKRKVFGPIKASSVCVTENSNIEGLNFEGIRFSRCVLSSLMVAGNNIIEPWGVEFADSHSFFSLEDGFGFRYKILEKCEDMSDTSRKVSYTIRMQEGLVRFSLCEWLEASLNLRRILRLYCLEKTNLMDFVLRFRFKQAFFNKGIIDGKVFRYTNSHIYHQYPVDSVEIENSTYRIQVNIVDKIVPPNMRSFMYLKDAEGNWVIHARMLPLRWNKEVIKLCSRFFKTTPIPNRIARILLKSKGIKETLWYRGERHPYRSRFVSFFSPNAYPIAEMKMGTELMWDVRCKILPNRSVSY